MILAGVGATIFVIAVYFIVMALVDIRVALVGIATQLDLIRRGEQPAEYDEELDSA